MIQFFRRIRQKLLAQGRLSKYLVYALGEIALVMIGILLALQVNNWNEKRKTRNLEIQLYKELLSELEVNLEDVRDDAEDYTRNLNAMKTVRDMFVHESVVEDSLLKHGYHMIDLEMFTPKTSAFESLKSLGLNIIKNDSLRADITSLYQITFPNLNDSEQQRERNRLRTEIINEMQHYLKVDYSKIKKAKENGRLGYARDYKYFQLKNIDELQKEDMLIVNIQQSLVYMWVIHHHHKKTAEEIERVIANIKSQLANK